jgi:hypothetical protein
MLAAALPALAQEKRDAPMFSVYKVDFTLRDGTDGGKSARHYTMLIDSDGHGTFRVGNKVPYQTGNAQFNYADVGVNIDCRLRDGGAGKVVMMAEFELSAVVPPAKGAFATPPNPTMSQTRVGVNALLQPGKPVLIAAIDDPMSARRLDIETSVAKVE